MHAQNSPIEKPSHSEPDAKHEKSLIACLIRLWEIFSDRYGTAWTAPRGPSWDTDSQPWLADLHDLTPQEFAAGVRADLERKSSWPPSAAEFRAMAISERRSSVPAHQLVESGKRIAKQPDSETAERWTAYCVGVLGVKPLKQTMTLERAAEVLQDVDVGAMSSRVDAMTDWIRSRYR